MATYSFIDVTASILGIGGVFDLGYGAETSDEGIVTSMTGAKNTMTTGSDGSVMHSLHASKSGTVTVNLLKTSPVNAQLSAMYNLQSQSSTTWGNNIIVIRNSASNDICTCREVAFQQQPDFENATDGGTVSWVFDAGKIDMLLGEF